MEPRDLQPGDVLSGEYRIEGLLGRGGMGAVYAAEQLSTGRRRALKVMKPELVADERSRNRFIEEAKVGARIRSAHVVEVTGAGVDEPTGMPWLSMELLEGRDLDSRVRDEGPLSGPELASLYAQLAHALGQAHAQGVIHRDLKPENLFLAKSHQIGGAPILKILDFGIATFVASDKTAATVTTAIGSPLWIAPEQTQAGAKLRPSTDVWAMGLIAFWLLTGRSYWYAANSEPFNLTALLAEILIHPLATATQRASEIGAPALPPWFDGWFARCVARDPTERYENAEAAAHALAEWASGSSPVAFVPATVRLDAVTAPRRSAPSETEPLPATADGAASASVPSTPDAVAPTAPLAPRPVDPRPKRPVEWKLQLAIVAGIAVAAALTVGLLTSADPPGVDQLTPGPRAMETAAAPASASASGEAARPRGVIQIRSDVRAGMLWVNGALRGPLLAAMTLELTPGAYDVQARAGDGTVIATETVLLREGQTIGVELSAPAEAAEAAVQQPPIEEPAAAQPREGPESRPRRSENDGRTGVRAQAAPTRTPARSQPIADPLRTAEPSTRAPASPADERRAASDLIRDARREGIRGNHEEAIRLLERARTLTPSESRIYLMLYTNYSRTGQNRQAARALREYLRREPNDSNAAQYRDIIRRLEGG